MTCSVSRTSESFSLSGRFDSSILLEVKPPTGEPYAGNPPVRFGGRGSCGSPYPYHSDVQSPALALWARDSHGGGEGMVWCGSELATSFSETTSKTRRAKIYFFTFLFFLIFFLTSHLDHPMIPSIISVMSNMITIPG